MRFILLILLIAIIILINIPIYIELKIEKKKKNNSIRLNIFLIKGLFKIQNELEYQDLVIKTKKRRQKLDVKKAEGYKIKENKGLNLEYITEQFHILKRYLNLFRDVTQYIIKKITFVSLNLSSKFGLGDAALTGIAYGMLWTIISVFINVLFSNKDVKNLNINLYPDFNATILEIDFFCIIKIKIAHIIIASLKGIKVFIKGGVFNDRSSYPRSYENNYGKY